MTFKPGDIVKLKSGGPPLTVWGREDELIRVCWFAGDDVRRDSFAEVELEPIEAWQPYKDPSEVLINLFKEIEATKKLVEDSMSPRKA